MILRKSFGNLITVQDNFQKGAAKDYFGKVSATIWDVPAGGFIESLLHGTPAFSFANKELNFFQAMAKKDIYNLKKCKWWKKSNYMFASFNP